MKYWVSSLVLVWFALALLNAASAPSSITPEQRANAKALDEELTQECQKGSEACRQAYAGLLLQAQVRFAEWGYGVKITAEPDPDTIAAIRFYQHRNGLPETGKIDGLTAVRMDADEEAVKPYPFTLPVLMFPSNWYTFAFAVSGVFRDTSTGQTSGPISIECYAGWHLCLEEESTLLTPAVAKMEIKEWTSDHILAEEEALCYTNQLRIEHASKTIIHTSVRTHADGPCAEGSDIPAMPSVMTEQLVDGIKVAIERNSARAAAVRRVKLVFGYAKQQMERGQR